MIHSAASEATPNPDVTADERRWTPIESRSEDCQSRGRVARLGLKARILESPADRPAD